jgi:TolB-like protein/DNA-binding winged helix-turn-helix (wHTH) protein/Tfp pilus assembly protein PilF
MAMATERRQEAFRVGDLLVDVAQRSVRSPTGAIDLPKLSFELLLALIRNAPAVVSNDELARTVWAGLVVSPETVTKRVNLLRDALGDDAAQPRYIAGLRGQGYRLIVPVERVPDPPSAPQMESSTTSSAQPPDAPSSATAKRSSAPRIAAVLGLGLVAAALGIAWFGASRKDAPAQLEQAQAMLTASDTTVAVLPFVDPEATESGSPVASGLADMIMDRLATVPQLTVIARGSAFDPHLRGRTPREIGQQLQARFLVEGSTQRSGDELRVTARLVDTRDGTQVWSTHLDRPVARLFDVQDEIATSVADALRKHVSGSIAAPRRVDAHEPPVTAQLAYLEARALLSRTTVKDSVTAAGIFERVIEQDPSFAAAYAGLFDARMLETDRRHEDLVAAVKKHGALLERAFALDPDCGAAYLARATWSKGGAEERDRDFRRGLELDPGNSRGLISYHEFLNRQDRAEEARTVLERAQAVDPMSPRVQFRKVMQGWENSGGLRLEEGMRNVLAMDPNYQPALQHYAKYRWMFQGNLAEAAQLIERAIAVDPENPWSRNTASAIYLDLGDAAQAEAVARGTPSSAASAALLLALYRHDVARAGAIALSPAGQQYAVYESWGAAEAVRDEALRTGDYQRGIQFLRERYGLQEGAALRVRNFRAAAVLAQLLAASGDTTAATALLQRLPEAIDATLAKHGTVIALRTRAMVEMQLGQREAALTTLIASFRANDLMQWWYTFESEPLWRPLRGDPRFQALEAEVRARVAEQRGLLQQMRAAQAANVPEAAAQK